jgi:S-adenosylmethionine uptake transporter
MPARLHPSSIAFLVGTLGIASFAVMDAVMKGLVLAIGTFATMFWRNLIGIGVSGLLYWPKRRSWPTRRAMRLHIARGVLSTAMGFLFFWGIGRVPLAQAVALAFISPLIAIYMAAVLLGEEVSRRTVLGSLAAFGGILLILVGQAQADLGRDALIGSLAVLASALLYAGNIILMRQQSLAAEPVEIAFVQSVVVVLTLACALPLVGLQLPPDVQWPWLAIAAILAIASMLLMSWAYARAEASYLATTEYTAFLWAALLGWLIFGEPLSPLTLAGAALIVAGCIAAARRPEDANPKLEAATP